ncbi:MAG: hypothetical protein LBQ73_02265 [Tannerellaceae bacterium]|jgi:hypothetical protein|nr:hypothetical protein [Tannerellaceae bacterium]
MGSIVKTKVSNLPRVGDIQDFIVFGAERTTNHSAYADMVQLRGNRGEKILLRKGAAGIEYKYEEQPDSTYQLLIPYEAIKMLFSDLTAEEIEMLKLHFSDLTAADIAALQKPATDAADALEEYLVEKDAELTQLQTDTDAARLSAIEATESANDAIGEAEAATENANTAALAANNATSLANTATTEALAATENAIDAALTANNATSLAAAAALEAGSAAEEAEEATAAAEEATNEAKELTAHPPKIVSGEWWIYDLATHDYINTNLPSRGPEGKGPVVLPNGNYGNWNESAEEYEDSGIEAAATVNLDDVPVAFTEAEEIEPLVPGDTVPDALGKLSAWQSALGRVIFKAENKTTAAGTAAKVLTADEGYTPAEGDLLLVTWTINNSVGAPTFNINGVVYPVWFNGTNINSTTNITTQYTIAANSRVLYVFQDGKFHQVGSNIKYAVELCGVIHGGSAGRQIAQPITGYSFAMEAPMDSSIRYIQALIRMRPPSLRIPQNLR